MRRVFNWIWNRGIVSTFVSGLFAILPLVITVAIVSWLIRRLHGMLGPETTVGSTLRSVGLEFVSDEATAIVVGWVVVLVGIWTLGLLTMSRARQGLERSMNAIVGRIPIVKGVYGTAAQVVGMLNRDEQSELKGMTVVYCSFGAEHGAGFLALLASSDTYRFREKDCQVVYIPTSPLPMSGGILFVPTDAITHVDMTPESLMQIYFSLGVLTSQVVPQQHQVATQA